MSKAQLEQELKQLSNSAIATHSKRFFKTGPGEYGEGDVFRGIKVPTLRKLVKKYKDISIDDTVSFLMSAYHEDRLLALLLLVQKFNQADEEVRGNLFDLYINNTRFINNWDLVDSSAPQIVGAHLENRKKSILSRFAKSEDLWERRIAILATHYYIKKGNFKETLKLAKILINDPEDLIHKAVGWMLREVGKCNLQCEEAFLQAHYRHMPRTMLRYAIERFPEKKRQRYLKGE
jgi:3-methyladenine DNA glycosylase AlkD